jgi:hypothetical protein
MEPSEFNRKLEELFSYHPPQNAEERAKHDLVNKATVIYAKSLAEVIKNHAELTVALRKLQEVRNTANFAVSCEREGISYRGLFDQQKQ